MMAACTVLYDHHSFASCPVPDQHWRERSKTVLIRFVTTMPRHPFSARHTHGPNRTIAVYSSFVSVRRPCSLKRPVALNPSVQ
jgi:hypothetical protein